MVSMIEDVETAQNQVNSAKADLYNKGGHTFKEEESPISQPVGNNSS